MCGNDNSKIREGGRSKEEKINRYRALLNRYNLPDLGRVDKNANPTTETDPTEKGEGMDGHFRVAREETLLIIVIKRIDTMWEESQRYRKKTVGRVSENGTKTCAEQKGIFSPEGPRSLV